MTMIDEVHIRTAYSGTLWRYYDPIVSLSGVSGTERQGETD